MRLAPFKRPPKRVLLWATPGFGDVLLATPLLRSIRQAYPEAAIDMIVHEGREAMLAGNPDLHRALPIPKRTSARQLLDIWSRTVGRYDLAAHAMGSDRAAFLLRCASPRIVSLCAADRWSEWWQRTVATVWLPLDRDEHQVLRHLRLADAIGVERSYEIVAPFDAAAPARLDEALPFDWRGEDYAVLHPATHATRKRWTLEGWQALGRMLADRGWRCVLTGGPSDDQAYLERIREGIDETALNVAGQLALTEVRALIEASRFYAGVDTATTHLAAAVGTPTVALYGPGRTNQWAPWPRGYAGAEPPFRDVRGVATRGNVCLVQADCGCGANYRSECGVRMPGRSLCLEELGAPLVLEAAERILETTRDSAGAC